MQDIRYWCEEGLIVADRSLVFSKSRERCWKKAEGESRSGGGEGGESLGVDWHGGKLSPTSGSEQPCLSILLSHDRKRHESETHSWSGGAVFVYRTRTAASHYAPYIYIYLNIFYGVVLCVSPSSSRHVGFLFTHVLSSLFYIPALSLAVCLSLPSCLPDCVSTHTSLLSHPISLGSQLLPTGSTVLISWIGENKS